MSISGSPSSESKLSESSESTQKELDATSKKVETVSIAPIKNIRALFDCLGSSTSSIPRKKETLCDVLAIDEPFEDFVRATLREPLPQLDPRIAHPADHPYLLYIARSTQSSTDPWKLENLGTMPINFAECRAAFEEEGGLQKEDERSPLRITFEDYAIFIAISTRLYGKIAEIHRENLIDLRANRSLDCKIYSRELTRESLIDLDRELRNLCNFVGLDVTFKGADLCGNQSLVTYLECIDTLSKTTLLTPEEREEFIHAFHDAATLNVITDKTIQRIQEGKFCTIPVGYKTATGTGHSVDLVFYKDHFVICNRGNRLNQAAVIEHYKYDPSLMDLNIIQFLIFNDRLMLMPNSHLAVIHQHLYLYTILPKILRGARIDHGTITPIQFKKQKVGNCSKASPLTAFKVGLYLKRIEEGKSPREAAWIAKEIGNTLSFRLRKKMIERAKLILQTSLLSEEDKISFRFILNEAEVKTLRKSSSKMATLKLQDLFSDIKIFIHFVEIALGKMGAIPTRPAHILEDHPLLLAIARQRKNLGGTWGVAHLQQIPIDSNKCHLYFQKIGGIQKEGEEEALMITPEDHKLFLALEKEILKYDTLVPKYMRDGSESL